MLDLLDFITDRGGNPEKIRESQRRRHAPIEIVDEIIEKFEDHRKTQYGATQIGSKINETQKAIGQKKKAKEDADDLLKQKEALQQEKLAQEKVAAEKLRALQATAKLVGNYVHESVPFSNDEVVVLEAMYLAEANLYRQTMQSFEHGLLRAFNRRKRMLCHIMRSSTVLMATTLREESR